MRSLSPRALLQTFVDERRAQRYSEAGIRHVEFALPRLFAYLKANGVADLKAVTQAHLTAYAHELARQRTRRGTRLASATRSVQIGAIRRFFAFLERRGVLFQNPAAHLPYPRKQRIPGPVMSEAQAERLMETPPATTRCGQRDRAILELLYGTGVRIGECARTDVCDLDLAEGRLLVRDGKGRKDRMVPVSGRARAALTRYLSEVRPIFVHDPKETALFLSHFGTRLKKGSLYVQVKGHLRAARLESSPHGLRHACATHLLRRGADIRLIQELLGHSQIESTAVYTKVDTSALRDVLDEAHPRGAKAADNRARQREAL